MDKIILTTIRPLSFPPRVGWASGVLFDKNGKYLCKRESKEEKRVYFYHKDKEIVIQMVELNHAKQM